MNIIKIIIGLVIEIGILTAMIIIIKKLFPEIIKSIKKIWKEE